MKKKPSKKGKGTIRKILGSPLIDPDPRNRKPKKKPIKDKILKAPSKPNRESMFKDAISKFKTRPPQTPVRKAPAKRPPGGGRPTPPAAPKAVPNLDPAMLAKVRSKLQQESIRRGSSNSSKPVAKKTSGSSSAGSSQKDQPSEVSKVKKKFKGPGMKAGGAVKAKGMARGGMMKSKGMARGGMMKSKGMKAGGMMKTKGYARGGAVNKRKATGAAKRGFGKAYMKSKR